MHRDDDGVLKLRVMVVDGLFHQRRQYVFLNPDVGRNSFGKSSGVPPSGKSSIIFTNFALLFGEL